MMTTMRTFITIWRLNIVSVFETLWVSIHLQRIYVLPCYKYNLIYSIHSLFFIYLFFYFNKSWSVEQLGTRGRCCAPAPLNKAEYFQILYNISSAALHWDSKLEKPHGHWWVLWCIIYGYISEIKNQDNCGTELCANMRIQRKFKFLLIWRFDFKL